MRNYYVPGDWNALCDICGFKHKASALRKNWKGQMVCKDDFETRHPQDFIRVAQERISTDWARPEPDDIFSGVGDSLLAESGEIMFSEAPTVLVTES